LTSHINTKGDKLQIGLTSDVWMKYFMDWSYL